MMSFFLIYRKFHHRFQWIESSKFAEFYTTNSSLLYIKRIKNAIKQKLKKKLIWGKLNKNTCLIRSNTASSQEDYPRMFSPEHLAFSAIRRSCLV
jgi:hypothetical protein